MKILIVVDMQKDFISGPLARHRALCGREGKKYTA